MKDQHRGKIDIEGDKRHMSPYKYQANKFMEPFTEKGKGDKRKMFRLEEEIIPPVSEKPVSCL